MSSVDANTFAVKLYKPPKARATAVQPRQITLKGILKSDVERLTNNDSEYRRMKPSDDDERLK